MHNRRRLRCNLKKNGELQYEQFKKKKHVEYNVTFYMQIIFVFSKSKKTFVLFYFGNVIR